jgi:hypothetical protein
MHVIWRRPDGFHGADPSDFVVVNVGNHSKLWLHKRDHEHFPFRITGGWQESEASARLNALVNLLAKDPAAWTASLAKMFHDQLGEDPISFINDLVSWTQDLRHHLKGDTWEVEIMDQALTEVVSRLESSKLAVQKAVKS